MFITYDTNTLKLSAKHALIIDNLRQNEVNAIEKLTQEINLQNKDNITNIAIKLSESIQNAPQKKFETLMKTYKLSDSEGIALMCLAEALLRVPDYETRNALIKDKLTGHNWQKFTDKQSGFWMNASAWSLWLTGSILTDKSHEKSIKNSLSNLLKNTSKPIIQKVLQQSMLWLGQYFILGNNINNAITTANKNRKYSYSYDMLGEAAQTMNDVERYYKSYENAILQIAKDNTQDSISIKLSSLHPRYNFSQYEDIINTLIPRVKQLALLAKNSNIDLTFDAELAGQLSMMLDVFKAIYIDPDFKNWQGLGLAVQAYLKSAPEVIDYLADLAEKNNKRINVRLIKGAYWDNEIKNSQVEGLDEYPTFTLKEATDISYQVCAQKLLAYPQYFYPQFATHNAYTVATIMSLTNENSEFEFQRLHGMGTELYNYVLTQGNFKCRVYAPVGEYETLLPYLVRRLLENGANSSFVYQIMDKNTNKQNLFQHPADKINPNFYNKKIPLPKNIFSDRINSKGFDFNCPKSLSHLADSLNKFTDKKWQAQPIINGIKSNNDEKHNISSPIDNNYNIGSVYISNNQDIENALSKTTNYNWQNFPVIKRKNILNKTAELLEKNSDEIIALLMLEAGKNLTDCINEIREAVDFLRYYGENAVKLQQNPKVLEGYTGETNELHLKPRGTMLCISPWNFPLAIFIGQISACLAVGNAVIAKPAEQTPLIASYTIDLLIQAGLPVEAISLLTGFGDVGAKLVNDTRIKGVLFTGSTEVARIINQSLANRQGEIVPLIAETGGQNAMIVDSTALLDQVVPDALLSAFGSAGQRCSALRVMFVQEDIADELIEFLKGAMQEIKVDSPTLMSSDLGPVIDEEARNKLINHCENMQNQAKLIYKCENIPHKGNFFAPHLFELDNLSQLPEEIFGPILHLIRYKKNELNKIVDDINNTGFGLTFGLHSRIDAKSEELKDKIKAGNIYINRNITGAIVGVQPFGGEGLSGTGPKAGGPNYLPRLCTEKTISINTSAIGGNASLLFMQ